MQNQHHELRDNVARFVEPGVMSIAKIVLCAMHLVEEYSKNTHYEMSGRDKLIACLDMLPNVVLEAESQQLITNLQAQQAISFIETSSGVIEDIIEGFAVVAKSPFLVQTVELAKSCCKPKRARKEAEGR